MPRTLEATSPRPLGVVTGWFTVHFRSRRIAVIGRWPGGHMIEWTAGYSLPVGSSVKEYEAEAIRQAKDQFGAGYDWEAIAQ